MTMQTTELTRSTPSANAEAVVDLDAIAHNVRVLREHAGSAQVMAVVKADGYGHGATQVARAALAAGAAELGVATIDEALALRRDGITAPVLAWLHPPGTDFAPALQADVADRRCPRCASSTRCSTRSSAPAAPPTVTVKVDTGLNRNGVSRRRVPGDADGAAPGRGRRRDPAARHHVASGLRRRPRQPRQRPAGAAVHRDAGAGPRRRACDFEVAHLSNSPAAMTRPDLAFDMVRPGIAVYGLTPIPERGDMGLRPAMTLKCPVALVRSVKAGDGVSYGHTWIADRDTTLALLPIGYADGVFRTLERPHRRADQRPAAAAASAASAWTSSSSTSGPAPVDVSEGDEAILFGPGADGEPTAQDWADLLGTINYEVVTSPRGRVTRTYRGATAETAVER